MLSASDANEYTKFFTHNWTMTIPARPSLKFINQTAAQLDDYLALIMDPANHPYDEAKVRDEKSVEEFKISTTAKQERERSEFRALNILVELEDQIIGVLNLFHLPTGVVNVGLLLNQSARGRGVGKFSVQVLIQFARKNMGIDKLEAGTMKANQPMRALMAGLKILERDEIKEAPGRGVVAEVMYTIPEKLDWDEIDLHVEFGEPAGSA